MRPLLFFFCQGPWLSKMTADTNSGALDTALDTAITYADLAPSDSVKLYASGEDSKMFLNIVDKSFSAKSSTLAKYVIFSSSSFNPSSFLVFLLYLDVTL